LHNVLSRGCASVLCGGLRILHYLVHTCHMTQMLNPEAIPQWDLADRLGKALQHSGVKVGEMAAYLGVSRNTVGNYLNRRTPPDRRTLLLWAQRTNVPMAWLLNGNNDPGTGLTREYVWKQPGNVIDLPLPTHMAAPQADYLQPHAA
jgi:transcriptional regulator with XRE-family HTH domain